MGIILDKDTLKDIRKEKLPKTPESGVSLPDYLLTRKPVESMVKFLTEDVGFSPAQEGQSISSQIGEAADRYPRGIAKGLQNMQQGQAPQFIRNIFQPTPQPKSAVGTMQDMGKRMYTDLTKLTGVPTEPAITDPSSKLQYNAVLATEFLKNLPFTTAGVTTDVFTNPILRAIPPVIAKSAQVPAVQKALTTKIQAPKVVDQGIRKIIEIFDAPALTQSRTVEGQIKQIQEEKVSKSMADWMKRGKDFFSKYGKPGQIEAEIRGIAKKEGLRLSDAEVMNIRGQMLDHWAKTVYRGKTSNVPLRLRSPQELMVGKTPKVRKGLKGQAGQAEVPEFQRPATPKGQKLPEAIAKIPDVSKLMEEAKKYKTPEEFIKSKGKTIYHGTSQVFSEFDLSKTGEIKYSDWGKEGIYFTTRKNTADYYRGEAVKTTDKEANRLMKEYEDKAREFGTSPMMAGIDLGLNSDKYKELEKHRQKWLNQDRDWETEF